MTNTVVSDMEESEGNMTLHSTETVKSGQTCNQPTPTDHSNSESDSIVDMEAKVDMIIDQLNSHTRSLMPDSIVALQAKVPSAVNEDNIGPGKKAVSTSHVDNSIDKGTKADSEINMTLHLREADKSDQACSSACLSTNATSVMGCPGQDINKEPCHNDEINKDEKSEDTYGNLPFPKDSYGYQNCDNCHVPTSLSPGSVSYTCTACEFRMCFACYSKKYHKHHSQVNRFTEPDENYGWCDGCGHTFPRPDVYNSYAGRPNELLMYCTKCGENQDYYALCMTCYGKRLHGKHRTYMVKLTAAQFMDEEP